MPTFDRSRVELSVFRKSPPAVFPFLYYKRELNPRCFFHREMLYQLSYYSIYFEVRPAMASILVRIKIPHSNCFSPEKGTRPYIRTTATSAAFPDIEWKPSSISGLGQSFYTFTFLHRLLVS